MLNSQSIVTSNKIKMKDLAEPKQFTKSPLIFLLLMGLLVVSTLVVASEYFLRPQIEAELGKTTIYQIEVQPVIKK